MFQELVKRTRTIRRFQEAEPVAPAVLRELVELARFGGSARNCQPLRFLLVTERQRRERIFPHLGWAGYLADWPGPVAGERPAAYIVCLLVRDRLAGSEREAYCDLGIATQNMLLGAAAKGIFGCRIGSFSDRLADELAIDDAHQILLVLALGYPAEQVVLAEVPPDGSIRYWRDAAGVHHVPKRSLEDITIMG
ncbi:MAG: nitroreductase family protein [Desulfurivibrio sp.]|nr:nitroreductase family protein [Desulfurivibrio sp.]